MSSLRGLLICLAMVACSWIVFVYTPAWRNISEYAQSKIIEEEMPIMVSMKKDHMSNAKPKNVEVPVNNIIPNSSTTVSDKDGASMTYSYTSTTFTIKENTSNPKDNTTTVTTDIRENTTVETDITDNTTTIETDITDNTTTIETDITNNTTTVETDITYNTTTIETDIKYNTTTRETDITDNTTTIETDITDNTTTIETDITDNTTTIETDIIDNTTIVETDITDNTTTVETDITDNTTIVETDITDNTTTVETDIINNTTTVETDIIDNATTVETNITENTTHPSVSTVERSVVRMESDLNTTTPHEIVKNNMDGRIKILIVTYMRSGSTFLGSMFMAHQDIFYVFEPMWKLEDHPPYLPLNGAVSLLKYEDAKVQLLKDIFYCKLERLTWPVMNSSFWQFGSYGDQFYPCSEGAKINEEMIKCLPMLVTPCKEKLATTIKTLRVRMSSVETMLQNDPDLKVINLVRDPRPTIGSQQTWGYTRGRDLGQYAKQHCDKVYNDVIITKRLVVKYPDRVRLVYYEDLAVNTEVETRQLYNLINLPFTDKVLSHIQQLSQPKECTGDTFLCIVGRNSTEQLVKWRMTMGYESVKTIDRQCGHVYNELGYLPVTSVEHFKDVSISLRHR